MLRWTLALAVLTLGCSSPSPQEEAPVRSIPLTHADGTTGLRHLLKVPVVVNGHPTTFVLDTGIGITLVDDDLLAGWGIEVDGAYTGKRMSGQEVTVPLARVPWLSVAGVRQEDAVVGSWDVPGFLPSTPEFAGVEGYLSLNALERVPFTLDYGRGELIVEDAAGLAAREAAGVSVPLELERDGPTLVVFLEVELPNGPPARVELDLGSAVLILNDPFMKRLGVDPSGEGVERYEDRDETQHAYVRHFATIEGSVAPVGAGRFAQTNPKVMFQSIIYDGLIGDQYMRRHTVTFDLPGQRLILGPRAE
ncbi:MAG: retropepsin-like aspartic protease [Planctomycetota bacterium]